jgi:CDP-glycerol glycerophosphotransferase
MRDLPLISVVVPVYNVREYLPQCLDSLLGESSRQDVPLEVIAVDDASADGSGALLDERSAADPRLTVIHLASNGGPGNARNTGLAAANGEYVWFVDGDDLLPPGALDAVASRLRADHPDVLLLDYEDLHPDGTTSPSPGVAVLRAAPAGSFTLAEAPQVVTLTMTAWSRLFRREFLVKLGEPFRPGIHEDIPVTCAALLSGSLSALASVCYRYRRSRTGSFMATTSTAHMAVFSAYEEVLGLLRERVAAADPVATAAVQSAMFERAIWHYTAVLQTTGPGIGPAGRPGLVPRSERKRFFERMHADFLRYRPTGYQLPSGARGAKFRLVERDAYRTYEMLEPLNKLRIALRGSSAG